MAGRRMYSEAEFAVKVKEAVAEKKAAQAEVMAFIRPELDRMTNSIDSANHLKATLGQQLEEVKRLQQETNTKLQAHIERSQELREEFGVDGLTKEQRAAAPEMLKAYVDGERSAIFWQELRKRVRPAGVLWGTFFTAIAAGAGYLVLEQFFHLRIVFQP